MSAPRHRWSEPARYPLKTERFCLSCGLIKVTRHVDDGGHEKGIRDQNGCLVWTEWHRPTGSDGLPERLDFPGDRTPPYEPKHQPKTMEA